MPDDQPHVVLVTADELLPGALGCYGNAGVETPNVDALADRGSKFEEAYTVSPWCLPARAALATGLFPHNNGAFTNYRKWEGRLDPELPNLYTMLGDAGYTTAHVGKCHYAPVPFHERVEGETADYERYERYYRNLGMDRLILQDDKQVSTWFEDDYSRELAEEGLRDRYREAIFAENSRKVFTFPGPAEWHPDAWVGDRAVEYIADYDGDDPLFTWVSFSGPHWPFDPPEEYLDAVDVDEAPNRTFDPDEFEDEDKIHYKSYHGSDDVRRIDANGVVDATEEFTEEDWRKLRRYYYANIALIDDRVGTIVDAVRENLGEDAIVIFMADHGEMAGDHSLWGKHNCAYENVWRIPLIVDAPGLELPSISDARTMLTDVTATCLDAAGVDTADLDGTDLGELHDSGGHEYVFAEGGGFAAVKRGRQKYVHLHQKGQEYYEFYDLKHDPNEFNDVSDDPEYQDDVAALRGVLLNRYLDDSIPFYPRPIDT